MTDARDLPAGDPRTRTRDPLAGYARLYAVFAVLVPVLVFQPLFVIADPSQPSGGGVVDSLWVELASTGHGVSVLAIVFAAALTAMLLVATFDLRTVAVPVGIAVGTVPLIALLLTRPGYSEHPDLTDWGRCGLVVGFIGLAVSVIHVTHLLLARSRPA